MQALVEKIWYDHSLGKWLLWPLAQVYTSIVRVRSCYLKRFAQVAFPVPIIVVGNLTVGGVGKTPLVISLAQALAAKGLRVGIVSRGYGATIKQFPHDVHRNDSASLVGDEPLLLAQKTQCPVVIAPVRNQAVQYLLDKYQSQVIISDDGLQHYKMGRAIEIVVIDGTRGLGNGMCLPAGPLREPASRLREADFIVANAGTWKQAYSMDLQAGEPVNLLTGKPMAADLAKTRLAAVAGIGNPGRFFATLKTLGFQYNAYSFRDHYPFKPDDFNYHESAVIMTEKDAVKCRLFASDRLYYLPVTAILNNAFWEALWSHPNLKGLVQ